jgi:hypothetical protein
MSKTFMSMLTFSELRELSKIPFIKYKSIETILNKDFGDVTICDLFVISQTSIFDHNFVELLFTDLYKRYSETK